MKRGKKRRKRRKWNRKRIGKNRKREEKEEEAVRFTWSHFCRALITRTIPQEV